MDLQPICEAPTPHASSQPLLPKEYQPNLTHLSTRLVSQYDTVTLGTKYIMDALLSMAC